MNYLDLLNCYNFPEWREHRRFMLKNSATLPIGTAHRGKYHWEGPAIITNRTNDSCFNKEHFSEQLNRIVDSEFHLMWNGQIFDSEMVQRCYADDDELLTAYKSLQLQQLLQNNTSRNNIVQNMACCLCTWQYTGPVLFVHSRSMDVRAAGLSDPLTIARVAWNLGAHYWVLYIHQPHYYIDTTKIARR